MDKIELIKKEVPIRLVNPKLSELYTGWFIGEVYRLVNESSPLWEKERKNIIYWNREANYLFCISTLDAAIVMIPVEASYKYAVRNYKEIYEMDIQITV